MNWTLEVVTIPVLDLQRAKEFYSKQLGFKIDFDIGSIVQLTPRGSGCSVHIGQNYAMQPGSLKGLQLVVRDLKAAHAELSGRGVDISEIKVFDRSGTMHSYTEGDDLNNAGFFFFNDPDGNSWAVQQISSRA
jgi:catechol 2,3-dioxygenase-like lactoylglutathione lyase family enzyme